MQVSLGMSASSRLAFFDLDEVPDPTTWSEWDIIHRVTVQLRDRGVPVLGVSIFIAELTYRLGQVKLSPRYLFYRRQSPAHRFTVVWWPALRTINGDLSEAGTEAFLLRCLFTSRCIEVSSISFKESSACRFRRRRNEAY